MSVKLLTEHHLEFLSLKGGCTGSSSHATAQKLSMSLQLSLSGQYDIAEASSTTRVLSSAHCTDARLYTLRIKIGTRTTRAREHSPC